MLTHARLWAAIDALAARHHMSPSALAKSAGLDPTTFNPSKRVSPSGREHWPTTESLAKVLAATGATFDDFATLMRTVEGVGASLAQPFPLIGLTQAGVGGFFDDGGAPTGGNWDEIRLPEVADAAAYALEVTGDAMLPLYRSGDILIVSPNADVRPGDRVLLRTFAGAVTAWVLKRRTARALTLSAIDGTDPRHTLPLAEVDWLARIIWASQ